VRLRVCVCVCERERERERDKNVECIDHAFQGINGAQSSTCTQNVDYPGDETKQ